MLPIEILTLTGRTLKIRRTISSTSVVDNDKRQFYVEQPCGFFLRAG